MKPENRDDDMAQNDLAPRKKMHFDNTINTGHLLTALAMIVSAIAAVILVQADLRRLSVDQTRIEATFTAAIIALREDGAGREARLRAAELVAAGQSSDLRSMGASLIRIERLLEARP